MDPLSKTVEERLADAIRENEQLRDSLGKLQAALTRTEQTAQQHQAAAESANQELQHFVYAASHDLQEPLRTIASYTQLIERQYADDENAREFAAFVIGGVNRMTELLQDLLTYSRVTASTYRTEVNMAAPLQAAIMKLHSTIKESGAQIRFQDLPCVQVNEIQLSTVFENLLSNSLKFHGESVPAIDVSAEEGTEGYTFSVADNGIGIDPRFQQTVLQPFKRLHGKEVPGSGLGLAICDKIIRAHGGILWIESDGQKGTTVRFTLPF